MPRESNLELKVGFFVILALISLTVFILSVGDFSIFQEWRHFRIVFNNANGVKKSAPVRIAGVEAGLVKDVGLFFDPQEKKTKVQVVIWIKKGVHIPGDSRVMVNQLGLFGEKYIEILPGTETARFFREGDKIVGVDPIIQEEISKRIMDVAAQLDLGISSFNRIIMDGDNQRSFKMTLQQMDSLTGRLDHVLDHVESGEGTLGRLLFDSTLYDDLHMFTADIRANPWKLLYQPEKRRSRR